ncbi:hypothetical protein INS49_008817 [Diaporthe citri]|uniref:uncharacterized protein n=1 Tax=Diaporthe citri TaxID=83186 RepID=UPI001C8045F9|nr:uncharacterized protein INS49_008817 [Diaporthe citri]KAG6363714.1 hypothetical protein INS49_008817 [Diaporthe citri]
MHFSLVVISCLQALALAHPRARFDEHDLILPRVNQNGTNVTDHADQDVPTFQKECVCPTPICDSRMNEKSICQCKASAAQACFLKSQGGCPEPKTAAC